MYGSSLSIYQARGEVFRSHPDRKSNVRVRVYGREKRWGWLLVATVGAHDFDKSGAEIFEQKESLISSMQLLC
jgi:hypothetical protein